LEELHRHEDGIIPVLLSSDCGSKDCLDSIGQAVDLDWPSAGTLGATPSPYALFVIALGGAGKPTNKEAKFNLANGISIPFCGLPNN
jgi:hypothetical protein